MPRWYHPCITPTLHEIALSVVVQYCTISDFRKINYNKFSWNSSIVVSPKVIFISIFSNDLTGVRFSHNRYRLSSQTCYASFYSCYACRRASLHFSVCLSINPSTSFSDTISTSIVCLAPEKAIIRLPLCSMICG